MSSPNDSSPTPPPNKRGRKPGPLSRSARETQRKLNHSIIEKARRTKINQALATLRQLVPADYAHDTDDDKKQKSKREEKEKEFKLEILIRTVSYMQDLVERVNLLESTLCPNCNSHKRKRDNDDDDEERGPHKHSTSRLPSISSWLPNSDFPLQRRPSSSSSSLDIPQLPSPPSSTHFDPVHTPHLPPVLNLGPVANTKPQHQPHLLSPRRTPDDESAASLLLQISASSPQLLPTSSSSNPPSGTSFDTSKMRTSCLTPVAGNVIMGTHTHGRPSHLTQARIHTQARAQAQTPGSMLGLMMKRG